jgi:O-antigen/teichoic acid export membrane protein
MSAADTKANFFRQSGWMMTANMVFGVFMAAANFMAVHVTPGSDYSVYLTILRIFVLVTLPAAAIQTLLAQQTAAAITEDAQRDVSATARGVIKQTLVIWVGLTALAGLFKDQLVTLLQASDWLPVAGLMLIILGNTLWPLFLGLLQGRQLFFAFGWSTILNGLSRFAVVALGVKFFQIGATGATIGAFAGFVAAILVAAWPARIVFESKGGRFDAMAFWKKVGLLTAGAGSTLFIINVDMPLVQSHFPSEITRFYGGAETIGIAVVTLCVPVAAVMFPKLVRSRATASKSDALQLAIAGTAIIGGGAAIFCTLLPEFPLRILFHGKPEMLQAAPLIPWFMWAMVPITIYNVLVNNLIARDRYGVIPFAAVLPIAYAVTLYLFLERSHQPPFLTFKRVIQILMFYSTALMLVSIYFSRRAAAEEVSSVGGGENRSQPTGAKP